MCVGGWSRDNSGTFWLSSAQREGRVGIGREACGRASHVPLDEVGVTCPDGRDGVGKGRVEGVENWWSIDRMVRKARSGSHMLFIINTVVPRKESIGHGALESSSLTKAS